ncbi:hypothetical protein ACMGDK_11430 [Chryseobacterium sp. DT-3]|uniref:hypothetical protein n=1 Tax=Chryseobacterium sp. DT-3 TaxID=3396164 RepID=UPI003F1ADF4E
MPTLKEVIEEIIYEATVPTSIFRNADEIMIDKYAKEGLKKLNLVFVQSIVGMNFSIPFSCKVFFPEDYMQFIRAYLINCDGKTIEIKTKNQVPSKIKHFLVQCEGGLLADCDGTNIDDECMECNPSKNNGKCDSNCHQCYGTGRYIPCELQQLYDDIQTYKNSWINVNEKDRCFDFSSDLEGMSVIVEYMGNDIHELDQCAINVPEKLAECLEYYIKYKILEGGIDTLNQSQYFKNEFKKLKSKELSKNNPLTERDLKSILFMQ